MKEYKNRRPIRLSGYDYSQSGMYFITICTQNRKCLFGEIINEKMVLNNVGTIVKNVSESLPKHHSVKLDTFQIMPNHIHMILILLNITGRSRPTPTYKSTFKSTLGFIVGMLKTESTKQINQYFVGARRDAPDTIRKLFQRNYYEHIIRNETELNEIRQYILNNPLTWDQDQNNPKFLS